MYRVIDKKEDILTVQKTEGKLKKREYKVKVEEVLPVPLQKEDTPTNQRPAKLAALQKLANIHQDQHWNDVFDSVEAPVIRSVALVPQDWKSILEDQLKICVKAITVPDNWAPDKTQSKPINDAKSEKEHQRFNHWEWGEIEEEPLYPRFPYQARQQIDTSSNDTSVDSSDVDEYIQVVLQNPNNEENWDPSANEDNGNTTEEEPDINVDVFALRAQLEASWPAQPRPYRTPDPPRRPLHLTNVHRSLPQAPILENLQADRRVTRQQLEQWAASSAEERNFPDSAEPNLRRGPRHMNDKYPLHRHTANPEEVLTYKTQALDEVFMSIEDDARRNSKKPRVTRQGKISSSGSSL